MRRIWYPQIVCQLNTSYLIRKKVELPSGLQRIGAAFSIFCSIPLAIQKQLVLYCTGMGLFENYCEGISCSQFQLLFCKGV